MVRDLLSYDRHIDLVIPRGSNDLVRYVKNNTRIPVLGHADGLCSIYIHRDAEPDMAVKVVLDAKVGYPAACNSVETLLVDEATLSNTLPLIANALITKGVRLRCDPPSLAALSLRIPTDQHHLLQPAVDADYRTEFLDLDLAIKTIFPGSSSSTSTSISSNKPAAENDDNEDDDSVRQAIEHINSHSSHHTDAIITANPVIANLFLNAIDSAGVYWNSSTRMADGLRYGFGTEVGISTNKIHARGPVGLEGLVIYKYLVRGHGHVVADYDDGGRRRWIHRSLPL